MGSQSNRYSLSRFAVEEESIVPHDETVAPDVDLGERCLSSQLSKRESDRTPGQYTQMVPLYVRRLSVFTRFAQY